MIKAAGHEIGHHGWVHENPLTLTPEQEREVMEKGLDALDKIVKVRPIGYRSPAWDNSPVTVPLLLEYGFEYESSLMGSDYEPYWCRVGDEFSTTEDIVGDGRSTSSRFRWLGISMIGHRSSTYGPSQAVSCKATRHPPPSKRFGRGNSTVSTTTSARAF